MMAERFAEQKLSAPTLRALDEALALEHMTEIQAKTLAPALEGRDVLGRARTGTGKTVAFLVPALERLTDARPSVDVLAISPTRELATQISTQAADLLRFQPSSRRHVQTMFGGTKSNADLRRLERAPPCVLVATPGRLLDHLRNSSVHGQPFAKLLGKLQVLVLDEADQLLEMGFRKEIEEIIRHLPSAKQTFLFSATVPPGLRGIMGQTMRAGFETVDCVQDGDPASHTNANVPQSHVVLPSAGRAVAAQLELVRHAMGEAPDDHKIIAFFPTAAQTAFASQLFNATFERDGEIKDKTIKTRTVMEIHSRKSQSARNKCSDAFRAAKRGVLFSSDVSARGVDYPDVTHVLQFGLPMSREQYIHRLGRTGRAGKAGKGVILLSPFEVRGLTSTDQPLPTPTNRY